MFRRAIGAAALACAVVLSLVPVMQAQAAAGSRFHLAPVHTDAVTTTFESFAPRKGPMGTKVVIVGTGFQGATKVLFHGVAATFHVVSGTKIRAVVPCGTSSGRIAVRTPGGTARSVGIFTIP